MTSLKSSNDRAADVHALTARGRSVSLRTIENRRLKQGCLMAARLLRSWLA
jgi:hypothetical protein